MDVNSINNNITSLNNVPNQQLGRSESTQGIENNDQFLKLSINEYNQKRDELSASLQAFNEGIGISITAQNGLQKEQEHLQNIHDRLIQVKDEQNLQDKNQIKNELNQQLLGFREEAFRTTYNKENLLSIDDYEENLSIDISTKEAYFSIDKPNTPEVASQIGQEISRNDLNTEEGLDLTLQGIENGIGHLQNIQAQFQNLNQNLQESARTSIQEQRDLSNQNRANKQFDFPKEVTDFTKTNVTANAGYLAASQANIVQEQTVRLVGTK